ncbi:transposase [Paraphaeosphaeria sporulosa]
MDRASQVLAQALPSNVPRTYAVLSERGHIGKEHFTSLYKPARNKAFTKRNILAGWAATGLFPFNPDRVLRAIQKPPPKLIIPDGPRGQPASALHDEVLPTPLTPVTPKTTEALASLRTLIERDACTLDQPTKQRLRKHVQKIATAAKVSFAECALLQDQNQFLFKVNNAKTRRLNRSVVLGKAKVMSYKDLEEARAKREAKHQAAATHGKRGRKRKALATEEAEAGPSGPERRAAAVNEVERASSTAVSWVVPVAKMY